MECVNCGRVFETRSKGFKRVPLVGTSRSTEVVQGLLDTTITPKSERQLDTRFLCIDCEKLLKTAEAGESARKELFGKTVEFSYIGVKRKRIVPLATSTPAKKPRKETQIQGTRSISTGIKYLQQYRYKSGFRWFLKRSKTANNAFRSIISKKVRKEVRHILKEKSLSLTEDASLDSFQRLDWDQLLQITREKAPLLYHALLGAITTDARAERTLTRGYGNVSMKPVIGCIISMILLRWKRELESHVFPETADAAHNRSETLEEITNLTGETSIDAGDDENEEEWEDLSDEEDENSDLSAQESPTMIYDRDDDATPFPKGYTLCWDNVGRQIKARHQTRNHGNQYLIWALAFLAKNRVNTTTYVDETTINAVDIATDAFMLTGDDVRLIRDKMIIVIGEVLAKNLKCLEPLKDVSRRRPKHMHSDESRQKSEIYNIGIIPENPSSTAGVINILELLQKYVPRDIQENPYKLITWGDGLSCERHCDAQNARANGATKFERLEGLEPAAQEFHKRMLLMQDTMDLLFDGHSGKEKGTLCHLKNLLNRRSVSKNVSETFNHVSEFLKFVTEGYLVLFGLRILGLDNLDTDIANDFSAMCEMEKQEYLRKLASTILDEIWCPISTTESTRIENDTHEFCFCKEDIEGEDDDLIKCENNDCENGSWFHMECVGLEADSLPDGPWYCSEKCRTAIEQYQYCTCKTYLKEEAMIECSYTKCEIKWYHGRCVGLRPENFPDEDEPWYCSRVCRGQSKKVAKTKKEESPDLKFEYTKCLVWRGVQDMVRHEAVRRNDGPMMTLFWKMDMMNFGESNHTKYFILAHRLIAALNGWLPERLRMDLTWNRTVNLTGGEASNDEIDLVNEFLNREFKESIKSAGSKLTTETLNRHGKLAGGVGKTLDRVYHVLVDTENSRQSGKKDKKINEDMDLFVKHLKKEELTKQIPGRVHKSFTKINSNCEIRNVRKYREKIERLSKRLDKRRRVVANQDH